MVVGAVPSGGWVTFSEWLGACPLACPQPFRQVVRMGTHVVGANATHQVRGARHGYHTDDRRH